MKQEFGVIFLDLDGTLIDVSKRYYAIYKNIVDECNVNEILSKDEYWKLRRSGVSFVQLLNRVHNFTQTDQALAKYLYLIEKSNYLDLDYVLNGVEDTIVSLKQSNHVVLVTLRKNQNNLDRQLTRFGLLSMFDEILSAPGEKTSTASKRMLIENSLFFNIGEKYIVGDTEVDIVSGREAGCITIAVVSSGIRGREVLSGYKPDYMVDDVSETPGLIYSPQ